MSDTVQDFDDECMQCSMVIIPKEAETPFTETMLSDEHGMFCEAINQALTWEGMPDWRDHPNTAVMALMTIAASMILEVYERKDIKMVTDVVADSLVAFVKHAIEGKIVRFDASVMDAVN